MKILSMLAALALVGAVTAQPPAHSQESSAAVPSVPKRIAKIMSKGDGRTKESAYRVSSVKQEYQILAVLGLEPVSQALVIDDKSYDLLKARDPKTGAERDVWFQIPLGF
jgi:hypothetical protein